MKMDKYLPVLLLVLFTLDAANGFSMPQNQGTLQLFQSGCTSSSSLRMALDVEVESHKKYSIGSALFSAALLAPTVASAEVPTWVEPTSTVLGPFLAVFSLAMLARIVLSWYPSIDLNEAPFNFVAWPTEPLLAFTRGVVPPAFGVDISPIVWLMVASFVNEVALGPQGILTLLARDAFTAV
mmetsp:Transcript_26352/g.48047  ORF Transcript_26352/g.48047 Transcript_26352/m.48047 type:complete len:182 (+) Transcript_26352:44-589(+)